ncbi:MAG: undecaprenyldiphospho-muramoylpentapeptide beta-N-acetylglucosaminyltransferase [Clostridium argentinense]|uniref:UDP-N-acetylglucosamine--N-acetylmuramyl-(pentapeptide) pyrophosphoryl-undecaprenol N-acetylglucosamine transferase n=2 Tax=Clostridiaceae TaxID=31979 RepID=A0ABR8YP08_9CLOT|nr:undecaprenyldiphospho-muramoylpentapeptide beta-N-acetylglucosaminyltransferase [Clostridium faecium]MBS5823937.1 undecaprenyldiphospho-muramoylpentapeptide beta-N-acetylglucosaminyltransferase [Clostridium argentinense]
MTGGGSAGHVTPNIALMPKLKTLGYDIQYIGTKNGIERQLIEAEHIKYHVISSGKLRRYFDLKNFTDPFRVVKGVFDAISILKKEKPNIVFSKGGFVSVPVVLAAKFNKIPVIIHEADMTPGLANKISMPYCSKICVTFPEALNQVDKKKSVLTGLPIRSELLEGSKIKGQQICSFKDDKPIVLVVGGSLGSKFINDIIRENLQELLQKFNIVHVCGKGNISEEHKNVKGYVQFEYVKEELPHLMKAASIVVSRAGANFIFELLALKKPNLLIPLSARASRGDQILNAKSFEKNGYSLVIEEENLNSKILLEKLDELYSNKEKYIEAMDKSDVKNSIDKIIELIENNKRP